MAPISFEDITSSKPFTFCVGPNLKEFTIHSRIAAAQSKYFDTLINGNFKEARESRAELLDVDEKTFGFFAQYVYTGCYGEVDDEQDPKPAPAVKAVTTPEPKPEPTLVIDIVETQPEPTPEPQPTDPEPEPLILPASSPVVKKKKKCETCKRIAKTTGGPTKKEKQWKKFLANVDSVVGAHTKNVVKHLHPESLIWHAKMYVFAECYDVPKLRDLACANLGKTLVGLDIDESMVNEVTNLVEYCFQDVKPSGLRNLVLAYATCKIRELMKGGRFRELLAGNVELSVALIDNMLDLLD